MTSLVQPSRSEQQLLCWGDGFDSEDEQYLAEQLVTCIGNKRALLSHIGQAVAVVKGRLAKEKLRIIDAFAGSGVVSRFFKQHSSLLVSNDLEPFATAVARSHLRNRGTVDLEGLGEIVRSLNDDVERNEPAAGFIEELYAPKDENAITIHDRVFYTRDNARRLDNYRRLLKRLDPDSRDLLLGPLLSEASIHTNTAGVFKGFYKDKRTRIGRFGGSNGDALYRIRGKIELRPPVLSRFDCDVEVHQGGANEIVPKLRSFDLAYFDPPYNQHPYGSNYFMLNLLVNYERPRLLSTVSGIPTNWQRSPYNVRSTCYSCLKELVERVDASHVLVSFNNEGFIPPDDMHRMLSGLGSVQTVEVPYNAFRGSRNFRNRSIHVTEQLFLVEKH
jgi:adenine-specific DNA-methyltransferase